MIHEIKVGLNYFKQSVKTVLIETSGKLPKFEHLFWEVTDACNSHCKNCNIWRRKVSKDILTLDEVKKIFSSGFFREVKDVIISGGEPILLPDLEEKLSIMNENIAHGALVSLSTNGLLPDKVIKVTKNCLKNGMNIIVGVSLDGVGEHHDFIRGVKGNFEKVNYLLKELLKLKKDEEYKKNIDITVGYTFSPLTFNYFNEVQEYSKSLGIHFLPQMYEQFSYYSNTESETTYNESVMKAINDIPDGFQKEVIKKCVKRKPLTYRCSSMKNFFVLHCNGDISPCLRFAHIRAGNIRNDNINEIWNTEKVKEARIYVKNCKGCSNTWATGWSIQYWMPSFLGMLCKIVVKKEIARLKKNPKFKE